MRVRNDTSSPWQKRIWFEEHEFDAMMDEARSKAGTVTFSEGAGIDVEAVLQGAFKIVPDFVDLDPGVLGRTAFHRDGHCEIQISRTLAEAADGDLVARRRLRSTIAHEAGHVVQHAHLHVTDTGTLSLFEEPAREAPKVLCRQETVESFKGGAAGYDGEWWEYQANRGMASLLLPRREVMNYLLALLSARGFETIREAMKSGKTEEIVREIMRIFDVNMPVVVFRLQELGSLPKNALQATFALENARLR